MKLELSNDSKTKKVLKSYHMDLVTKPVGNFKGLSNSQIEMISLM